MIYGEKFLNINNDPFFMIDSMLESLTVDDSLFDNTIFTESNDDKKKGGFLEKVKELLEKFLTKLAEIVKKILPGLSKLLINIVIKIRPDKYQGIIYDGECDVTVSKINKSALDSVKDKILKFSDEVDKHFETVKKLFDFDGNTKDLEILADKFEADAKELHDRIDGIFFNDIDTDENTYIKKDKIKIESLSEYKSAIDDLKSASDEAIKFTDGFCKDSINKLEKIKKDIEALGEVQYQTTQNGITRDNKVLNTQVNLSVRSLISCIRVELDDVKTVISYGKRITKSNTIELNNIFKEVIVSSAGKSKGGNGGTTNQQAHDDSVRVAQQAHDDAVRAAQQAHDDAVRAAQQAQQQAEEMNRINNMMMFGF